MDERKFESELTFLLNRRRTHFGENALREVQLNRAGTDELKAGKSWTSTAKNGLDEQICIEDYANRVGRDLDFGLPTFHLLGDLFSILSHFGQGIFDVCSDFLVGPAYLVSTGV